jgi:methylenetetrahydrofolate--tRNA-(uracil-5-)-methyltransferase
MQDNSLKIHVIGGGLAGCEAAWQCLKAGFHVDLYEMRPTRTTEAHKTGDLAELVCSNSLKSFRADSAPGLLKSGMASFGSIILEAAEHAKVPAGQALAVERGLFSAYVEKKLNEFDGFRRVDKEVTELPTQEELEKANEAWVVATGPLTSDGLAKSLVNISGDERLYFYDAIAPVIETESIDMEFAFRQSRYDNEDSGEGDYINLPLNKEEYEAFIDAVIAAEYMPLHKFEETKYFESCLPIEVMIERGRETLRFGPMKPVGLTNPVTGNRPWGNIQLRQENLEGTMFSMVGFQTKMKWPDQKRVFSLIPALKNAEFFRFGSVHRNTYMQSPKLLNNDLSFQKNDRIFLAGQITGVEGYTESSAIGLLAGLAVSAKLNGKEFVMPPKETMIGALHDYVVNGGLHKYSPMNANLGLLPTIKKQKGLSKPERKAMQCEQSRNVFEEYATRTKLRPLNA